MKYCTADQWSGLGNDYNKTFYEYGLNKMYCPSTNTSLILNGTSRTKDANNITILLHPCDPITN